MLESEAVQRTIQFAARAISEVGWCEVSRFVIRDDLGGPDTIKRACTRAGLRAWELRDGNMLITRRG